MLERLKTSDAMAEQPCKSEVSLPNFKLDSKLLLKIPNSNLVLPSGIDLANELLDLRDLTDRYWRVIQAQHVRIARLESDLLCARTAKH
jgi:hypothetical protein